MQFVYYTEKTVAQSMLALNERLHQKSSRSTLEGWVEKNGKFSLAISSTVMKRIPVTTRLYGRAEKENGVTVIRGSVFEGADPRSRTVIYGILVLAGILLMLATQSIVPGIILVVAPVVLNIPLEGSYNNSQSLLTEVQRSLKTKTTPPPSKKSATASSRKPAKGSKPAPRKSDGISFR